MVNLREINSFLSLSEPVKLQHLNELLNSSHLKFSQQSNREHSLKTIEDYIQELRKSGGKFFLIILENRAVGTLTIKKSRNRTFNIGIMIYESYDNSQVATGALEGAMMLLRSSNASEVHMGTHIANMPMRRVIEKLGFQLVDKHSAVLDIEKIYFVKSLLST